ncbi:MAG: RIP metalloprotease RseP [Ardenticatenia bacterium]|nr:RIP metalloprotease RseP [Ardenticatenia bacterium]
MFQIIDGLPGPLPQICYFFLALFPLVMIHELGHFVLAKLNKVRVDEFGIGFPPRLLKLFTHGGTDYTINLLPLGGFVRLAGEDDPSVPGAFASRPKMARAAVLFAGPMANFLLAAGLLSALALLMGVPAEVSEKVPLVHVGTVVDGGAAEKAGILADDVVLAIDGQSLGALAQASTSKPEASETAAIRALMDVTNARGGKPMAVTVLRGAQFIAFQADAKRITTEPAAGFDALSGVAVTQVVQGDGSVRAGDLIWDFEGSAATEPLVVRGSPSILELTMTPRPDADTGRAIIGVQIGPPTMRDFISWPAAMVHGPVKTVQIMGAMVSGLVAMVRSPSTADIAGPVGISRLSQQFARQGWEDFLLFMSLLSINLGVINLLPIPALDGGRLIFILVEALRGRRIEPSREAVVHLVGFALVIGLMLAITAFEVFGTR